MKKILLVLLVAVSFATFGQTIPNQFKIDEEFSWGTDFKFKSSGSNGEIDQDVMSWGTNFTLKINGKVLAKAKERTMSWGSNIDILDGNGKKIGAIEQNMTISFFGTYSSYTIYNSSGKKIGKSEKHDLMTTSFTIKDMSGRIICKINRPPSLFSDSWKFNFINKTFDKRLILFIPCYKTHSDNEND